MNTDTRPSIPHGSDNAFPASLPSPHRGIDGVIRRFATTVIWCVALALPSCSNTHEDRSDQWHSVESFSIMPENGVAKLLVPDGVVYGIIEVSVVSRSFGTENPQAMRLNSHVIANNSRWDPPLKGAPGDTIEVEIPATRAGAAVVIRAIVDRATK